MITKDAIRNGMRKHIISFTVDPNMEHGTVCKIGDLWFYFGGFTAEELDPDEYLANVPEEDIVREIFDTLKDFYKQDELRDEYDYYAALLFPRK